ncbi:MAG: MlaD family protein [Verrucomicrobiota bacterium]
MNPTILKFRIGLFIIVAIALFIGSLFFFGLTNLFEKQVHMVSFFGESVRGLSKGSLVRFRGVEVGKVTDIRLSLGEQITADGIPVTYEIDMTNLQKNLGIFENLADKETYENAIRDGLTAKLESASLLTGQLFIELDFRPGTNTEKPWIINGNLHYIPSLPSFLSDVTDQSMKIINDVSEIDFPELGNNLNALLVTLNDVVLQIEPEQLAENVNSVLVSVQGLIDSGEIENMVIQFTETASSLESALVDIQEGKGNLGKPLSDLIRELADTTGQISAMLDDVSLLIKNRSGPIVGLDQTLDEVRSATAAFQSLLEFLRRHPNALIFGKQQP